MHEKCFLKINKAWLIACYHTDMVTAFNLVVHADSKNKGWSYTHLISS